MQVAQKYFYSSLLPPTQVESLLTLAYEILMPSSPEIEDFLTTTSEPLAS